MDKEDTVTTKCPICDVEDEYMHRNSITHKFNFMLFEWNKYRKIIVQDRNNIAISVSLVDFVNGIMFNYEHKKKEGTCIVKATVAQARIQSSNGINFLFTVRNIHQSEPVILLKAYMLHPDPAFQIVQVVGAEDLNEAKKLLPGATYSFKVKYLLREISVGCYKMPVMMKFQSKDTKHFSIGKEMEIHITDKEEITNVVVKSPFTSICWESEVKTWIATQGFREAIEYYPVPKKYYNVLKSGFTEYEGMPFHYYALINEIKEKIAPDYPTTHNYSDFFHFLLWLDEIGAVLMMNHYNMERVTMKRLPGNFLELEVPGLSEKRPSLLKGDLVKIRPHKYHTGYKGIIQSVKCKCIWINGLSTELTEYIEDNPELKLDVSFQLSRITYERMHAGIDMCVANGMVQSLFPDASLALPTAAEPHQISNDGFFNMHILHNQEQKRAVLNILNCKSGKVPYIIFGPPGTGKTITIVEAILQIKRLTTKRILVCSPANATSDWIAEKLILTNKCSKGELLRLNSLSRDWSTVPEQVKPYCNYSDAAHVSITDVDLLKYRIVVSTLINIGSYLYKKVYCPDFVFIDEAAQAVEPAAAVAIGLLKSGKQLVLVGDPEQLGPICSSAIAQKYNLGVSLLERLMKVPLFKNEDPNFITMLKLNFRAHPVLLQLPNALFYSNQLKAMSEPAKSDPIATIFIYDKIYNRKQEYSGQPVEFCSVIAKERREGSSPSYFNDSEIEMVLKYVKALLNLTDTNVSQSHIGIVTPYIRQVYRIKDALKQCGYSAVEVGTAESFQGKEKRIIIISTVRAQNCLLLEDKRYRLGFVKNKKRFNVAITRAMSKLIVIGCPNVLRYDKNCWLQYIKFCQERCSFFGGKMDQRTDQLKLDVISRIKDVELYA